MTSTSTDLIHEILNVCRDLILLNRVLSQITGSIPSELGALHNLVRLSVDSCALTGIALVFMKSIKSILVLYYLCNLPCCAIQFVLLTIASYFSEFSDLYITKCVSRSLLYQTAYLCRHSIPQALFPLRWGNSRTCKNFIVLTT